MKLRYQTILHLFAFVLALSALSWEAVAQPKEKSEKAKRHGWIGVMIQDVTEQNGDSENAEASEGAYIAEVVDRSPADSAGLREGDVIVSFAGKEIGDADDLTKAVQRQEPGTRTTVVVMREGQKKSLDITVGKAKASKVFTLTERGDAPRIPRIPHVPPINVIVKHGTLGMEVMELNEQLGEFFGAPNGEGVLVESVEKESPAASAGFKAGDVIVRAGKRSVDEVEDIRREIRKYDKGDKLEFEILRSKSKKTLTVTLDESSDDVQWNQFWDVRPGSFPDHQRLMYHFQVPGPDTKKIRIEMNRMQEELQRTSEDLPKMFHRQARVSTDDVI